MYGFTESELKTLRALKAPEKIQNFLDTLPMNFEEGGDTCMSPRRVLREGKAHCMEGAMLAAVALRLSGRKPLVMDLQSAFNDDDHVIAVFEDHGCYGAISKTNHAVLRYREPVYKTLRELAISYFHEYFLESGTKTLRSYSRLIDLSVLDKRGWMTSEGDVYYVPEYINDAKHFPLVSDAQIKRLRKADRIEREAGKIVEWKRKS
jgi:hypothetical protein